MQNAEKRDKAAQSQVHARYKPGASHVLGRCEPGTCEVRGWYMRGTKRPQARLKLGKSKMADGKWQRASHPKA